MLSAIVAIRQLPVTSFLTLRTTKLMLSNSELLSPWVSSVYVSLACGVLVLVEGSSVVNGASFSFFPPLPIMAASITTIITQNHHFLKIGFLTDGPLSFFPFMCFNLRFLFWSFNARWGATHIIPYCNTKVHWNFKADLWHGIEAGVHTIM